MAKYKVKINQEECISCGLCATECPEVFEMNAENKAVAKKPEIEDADFEKAKTAADNCPVNVIKIEKTG